MSRTGPQLLARVLVVSLANGALTVDALENGLALTPPMGWRSWNFFKGDISDLLIRGQIDALLVKRPTAQHGRAMSLVDLGYVHAGIDDGWQACDSYTVEPSGSPAFHDAAGTPIVNTSKFPDLKALSSYAASKEVLLGWYNNNCICHESGGHIRNQTWRNLSYRGDVRQLIENDFKGIKIDNCGLHNDMDVYAELMNRSGHAFLTERSDQGHGTPTNLSWCPYNLFRSSGDIRASWSSVHHNLQTVSKYTHISRPGCWAYPDMLQVGNLKGPLAAAESRTHFGAWCIVSSPLILGMDLTNVSTMEAVWPYISNQRAISINQAWAGDPGRRINLTTPAFPILAATGQSQLEAWAKRLPGGAMAVLLINADTAAPFPPQGDFQLNLKDVGMEACAAKKCTVTDVWAHSTTPPAKASSWDVKGLAPHDSAFLLFEVASTD